MRGRNLDIIIGLAVLLAIGWVVSKSKILSGILNSFGWLWNHFWGALLIGAGVWGLFTGSYQWWMALLSIAVGIYFWISAKTEKMIGGAVDAAALTFVDRLTAPETRSAEQLADDAAGKSEDPGSSAIQQPGPNVPDEQDVSTVVCPSCGATTSADLYNCEVCGAALA